MTAAQVLGTGTVVTVVTDAFAGMFGESEPPPTLVPVLNADLTATATVGISGGWSGQVRLDCSDALSVLAAGEVFRLAPDEVTSGQVQDALGELVNIIGGTVKSLLPGPSRLALPTVGRQLSEAGTEIGRTDFSWREQPFTISIFSSSAKESP